MPPCAAAGCARGAALCWCLEPSAAPVASQPGARRMPACLSCCLRVPFAMQHLEQAVQVPELIAASTVARDLHRLLHPQASWRTSCLRESLRRRSAPGPAKPRQTPVCAATPTMRQTRWHAGPRWRLTARAPRRRGRRRCSGPSERSRVAKLHWPSCHTARGRPHSLPLPFCTCFRCVSWLAFPCLNCLSQHCPCLKDARANPERASWGNGTPSTAGT